MVRGFSRLVLFLFLGLLRAPTRNSPERVRDTIWTFPERSVGNTPVWTMETPRFSFSQESGSLSSGPNLLTVFTQKLPRVRKIRVRNSVRECQMAVFGKGGFSTYPSVTCKCVPRCHDAKPPTHLRFPLWFFPKGRFALASMVPAMSVPTADVEKPPSAKPPFGTT